MKLYVYILKILDLNVLKVLKVYLLIADHSFHIFFSKISAILLSTDSHIYEYDALFVFVSVFVSTVSQ